MKNEEEEVVHFAKAMFDDSINRIMYVRKNLGVDVRTAMQLLDKYY